MRLAHSLPAGAAPGIPSHSARERAQTPAHRLRPARPAPPSGGGRVGRGPAGPRAACPASLQSVLPCLRVPRLPRSTHCPHAPTLASCASSESPRLSRIPGVPWCPSVPCVSPRNPLGHRASAPLLSPRRAWQTAWGRHAAGGKAPEGFLLAGAQESPSSPECGVETPSGVSSFCPSLLIVQRHPFCLFHTRQWRTNVWGGSGS